MKKLILIILSILISVPLISRAFSVTGVPFGGKVTSMTVCNSGILAYVKTSSAVLPVMWYWGHLPYLSYIPPHVGQQLLGMRASFTVPCWLGYYIVGYGFPIEYHGSSL